MTHPTDDEIMKLAGEWFHTGENQKRDDGYYYRSLGTPSNVRGSDLIEFARALLAAQPAGAMQEARKTLLIAAANFGGLAPAMRDRCIRSANALHEAYTPATAPLLTHKAEDAPSDAARYQYLRKYSYIELECDSPRSDGWRPEHLDAAIDAAIAKKTKDAP